MDPLNQQQAVQSVAPQLTEQLPQLKSHFSLHKVLLMLFGAVVVLGMIVGAYYLGTKRNAPIISKESSLTKPTVATASPTSEISPTPNTTANWKIYNDPNNYYSFQYPQAWILKIGLNFKTDTVVYDPSTTKNWPTNGNGIVTWPLHYVDILSIEATSTTATQIVIDYEKTWQMTDSQLHRVSVNKNGMDFEFYDLEGENAVRYRNVAISNGKLLLRAESSINELGDGTIESQILSTFKFTQ